MDLSVDEKALVEKWTLLKRIQSSGQDGAAKIKPCQDSEAERQAKLREAAKQALLASSLIPSEDSAKQATTQADGPGSSDEDEPLAQPKREPKKDSKANKPLQIAANNTIGKDAVEVPGQQTETGAHTQGMQRNPEYIVQGHGQLQGVPDGRRSDAAPPEAGSYCHLSAQGADKKRVEDLPVATNALPLAMSDTDASERPGEAKLLLLRLQTAHRDETYPGTIQNSVTVHVKSAAKLAPLRQSALAKPAQLSHRSHNPHTTEDPSTPLVCVPGRRPTFLLLDGARVHDNTMPSSNMLQTGPQRRIVQNVIFLMYSLDSILLIQCGWRYSMCPSHVLLPWTALEDACTFRTNAY